MKQVGVFILAVGECGPEDEGICYAEFSKAFQQSVRNGMPVQVGRVLYAKFVLPQMIGIHDRRLI